MLCKTALELCYFRSNTRKPLCLAKGTTKTGRMEIKSDKLDAISGLLSAILILLLVLHLVRMTFVYDQNFKKARM